MIAPDVAARSAPRGSTRKLGDNSSRRAGGAASRKLRAVAVAGNSLGWYTALAVGGALSFEDGFRLVQVMSLLQHEHQQSHGEGEADDRQPPGPAEILLKELDDRLGEILERLQDVGEEQDHADVG